MSRIKEYRGFCYWVEDGWWIVDYPYDGEFGGELEFETEAEARQYIKWLADGNRPWA